MLKKYLIALTLCVISCYSFGQQITPTDLIQLHKAWQMTDPHADKLVYDYLMSVDKNWRLREKPTLDDKGFTALYGYSKDQRQWYKPDEYVLMVSLDVGPPYSKGILYGFTDPNTWNEYKKQMIAMEATKIGSSTNNGGQQTTYTVNGIAFTLTEFPPGINGADRCYQVSILKSK